jgi:hypothetical protein
MCLSLYPLDKILRSTININIFFYEVIFAYILVNLVNLQHFTLIKLNGF